MTCPKCGSDKVTVTIEQTSAKTRKRGTGILWGIGRFFPRYVYWWAVVAGWQAEGNGKHKIYEQNRFHLPSMR